MTTGQQLVSEGRPITLATGEVVRLKITNRAMVKIEEVFGSYADFQAALSSGSGSPKWTAVAKGVWCALQHEPEWRNDWARVVDSLDPSKALTDYQDAILDAIIDAFPPMTAAPEQPPTAETRSESGGPNSTQLADAISGSDMRSSGI